MVPIQNTEVLARGCPNGRPRATLCFALHVGPMSPERQEGNGARHLQFGRTGQRRRMNALSAPRQTMQQKVGRRDVTPNLLLKHPNTTIATYV
jgi:hypothetical protein